MANGQDVGYVRVSSATQNPERQLNGVSLDKVFSESVSGKDISGRKELTSCLSYLREGDTLHIHSMDRLARNLTDLRKIVKDLTQKGVSVKFHREGLTFTGNDSPISDLILSILGSVAEFERALIAERRQEGIELAKLKGVYKGSCKVLKPAQVKLLNERALSGENKSALAREFKISRASLYNYISSHAKSDVKSISQMDNDLSVKLVQ